MFYCHRPFLASHKSSGRPDVRLNTCAAPFFYRLEVGVQQVSVAAAVFMAVRASLRLPDSFERRCQNQDHQQFQSCWFGLGGEFEMGGC